MPVRICQDLFHVVTNGSGVLLRVWSKRPVANLPIPDNLQKLPCGLRPTFRCWLLPGKRHPMPCQPGQAQFGMQGVRVHGQPWTRHSIAVAQDSLSMKMHAPPLAPVAGPKLHNLAMAKPNQVHVEHIASNTMRGGSGLELAEQTASSKGKDCGAIRFASPIKVAECNAIPLCTTTKPIAEAHGTNMEATCPNDITDLCASVQCIYAPVQVW